MDDHTQTCISLIVSLVELSEINIPNSFDRISIKLWHSFKPICNMISN